MLKSGNGKPLQCVKNLMQIVRGEIPFDRVRGLDARLVDKPSTTAAQEYLAEAKWNIETYEPRMSYEDTNITVDEPQEGVFTIEVSIKGQE